MLYLIGILFLVMFVLFPGGFCNLLVTVARGFAGTLFHLLGMALQR